MNSIEVNILGCGSAKPTLRHNPSCTVLKVRESLFMIDCGEGSQQQMQRMRLKYHRLNNIFITHLHGDHLLGLPGLLSTLSLHAREGYITVYTFAEGIKWLKSQMAFFGASLTFDLRYKEVDACTPAVVYEDKAMTVRTVPLNHRVPCVGYIFEEKLGQRHINKEMCDFHNVPLSRMKDIKAGDDFIKPDGSVIPNSWLTQAPTPPSNYAHIGDTAYMPEIAPIIGPVSLLYHETTYTREHTNDAILRGHSTAEQAARMALACGAKQLVTGHYSSRYKDDKVFLDEAKPIFPNTILGYEGLCLKV